MAQNIVIILTEGDHDAAFLYRILRANGFAKFSEKIKNFPTPLNQLFVSDVMQVSLPEVSLQHARSRFLPYNALTIGNNLLLIYLIGGDSKPLIRISLLETFNSFVAIAGDQYSVIDDTSINFLYFLDADLKGVGPRLEEVNEEIVRALAPAEMIRLTENKTVVVFGNVSVGAFIFTEAGQDKGKLEDLLIPLMKKDNDDIFDHANTFLSIHESTQLFRGKITYNDDHSIHKVNNEKYDPKKSIIGTICQLQKSGKSNTVCISDADYLTNEKLTTSDSCLDIVTFVRRALI